MGGFPDLLSVFPGLGSGTDIYGSPVVANYVPASGNPPFYLSNFFAFYPKFGGVPTPLTVALTAGQATFTSSDASLVPGALIVSAALTGDVFVNSVNAGVVTMSAAATTTSSSATVNVFPAPLVPFAVIQSFIAMANASIAQARWGVNCQFGVCLYVAHMLTLFAQSDVGPANLGAGLAQGITTSESAGGVSYSSQPLQGFADYGTWALTQYGLQLITLAQQYSLGGVWVG